MRQGRTSIRLSTFICMSKEFLQVYFKDACESPYLKHLHSFIPPLVIFFSFCRRPLKIPENNICFQMIGVESSIVFFPLNPLVPFFPTERLPDFSFYFKIMLLNQMIQFRFLLLRLKKKGGGGACAVGFSKQFTLFSSRPCQLQCSNSSQSGSTIPNPIPPGFSCWPPTKTWLQLHWPLTSLTLSSSLFWC